MSGFLVDTSILSKLTPDRSEHIPVHVAKWFVDNGQVLFISTMTIAEIEKGISKLRRSGAEKRTDALSKWLDDIERSYFENTLDFDRTAARIAGRLDDAAVAKGAHPGPADIIIAATAKAHDLTILTANERHFAALDVSYMNPFDNLEE